jgi:hypothetical protein
LSTGDFFGFVFKFYSYVGFPFFATGIVKFVQKRPLSIALLVRGEPKIKVSEKTERYAATATKIGKPKGMKVDFTSFYPSMMAINRKKSIYIESTNKMGQETFHTLPFFSVNLNAF